MQPTKKLTVTIVIALVLLMAYVPLLATPVQAQVPPHGGSPSSVPNGSIALPTGVTPDLTIGDRLVVSVRPTIVGLGQTVMVNMWMEPPVAYSRYIVGFKVTLTKPDGTTDVITLNSYQGDSTAWFEYTADQLGTWKVDFSMPGAYFPAGNYTVPAGISAISGAGGAAYTETFTKSCYYKPATAPEETFTVQSAQVASWPPAPLPSDYWTRPVGFENREWSTVLGDYPWWGPGKANINGYNWPADTSYTWGYGYNFVPYVTGPTSAHIVWKREGPIGGISGIIGGAYGTKGATTGGGGPNIIYQGRCYQTYSAVTSGTDTASTYWQCYDLRTGQVFWNRPLLSGESAPTYIEYSTGAESTPGASESVGETTSLIAIRGPSGVATYPGAVTGGTASIYTSLTTTTPGNLIKYSPLTGAVTTNITLPLPPLCDPGVYYQNGYVLSVQVINTTGGPGAPGTPTSQIYRLINWTTFGTGNFASRVASNITWPRADVYSGTRNNANVADFTTGIVFEAREANAFDSVNMGSPYTSIENNQNPGAYLASTADNASGIRMGLTIHAISLTTGAYLWQKTLNDYSDPSSISPYSTAVEVADHGKLAICMRDGTFDFWDEYTGALLFKSQKMDAPWDSTGFGAYGIGDAYGLLYRMGYGAYYAFNWTNGNIVWKFSAPAATPYESPYTDNGTGVYPWYGSNMIAGGMIYTYNTEHSTTQPVTRGWKLWCLNATTGQPIWNITTPGDPSAIADGYLSVSATDGYQYVFGRGQSKTTVTTSSAVIAKGQTTLIQGTVMDQSLAQPNTPCVSYTSMSTQMEYLHRQQPINGIWHNITMTGVPVTLTAIDQNGNPTNIGTATTSAYYGTFEMPWTPLTEGTYKIIASFAADDSYGSSGAQAAVSVGPAPTTTEPQQVAVPDYTMTILGVGVAIIIAVAIAAIVTILMVRKR